MPDRQLDLNLLKALDALLDECNVTRAAERLGVTQPAMSGMLQRLRDNLDDPLFVRTQRGIVPTPRAQEMAAPLKQILSGVGALLQPAVFDPATARFTLTIAATDYAQSAIAVPFLAALRRQAPNIRVTLLPIQDLQIQTALERGSVDLALLTPETTPPDLHVRNLFDEHYVCVMRADHPAAARPLDLDTFCRLDHALVSYSGGSFSGITDEALARLGHQRRVSLSVKNFLVLPEIIRTSNLVAVVPSRLVLGLPGLTSLTPPVEVPGFTKVLAWHARSHRDAGHRWLRELLVERCAAAAGDVS